MCNNNQVSSGDVDKSKWKKGRISGKEYLEKIISNIRQYISNSIKEKNN